MALSLEKICSSSDFFHDSLPTVFSILYVWFKQSIDYSKSVYFSAVTSKRKCLQMNDQNSKNFSLKKIKCEKSTLILISFVCQYSRLLSMMKN